VLATGRIAHTTMQQRTAALRDFELAYLSMGHSRPQRSRSHDQPRPLGPESDRPKSKCGAPRRNKNQVANDLFDYLVGEREKLRWNVEAECLGGFEVDDQFEL